MEVVEILTHNRQEPVYHTVNNMAAYDLALQGAKASVAMILTYLSWNIPDSLPEGLKH